MAIKDRKKTLRNIERLRRAEQRSPDAEVGAVREDLEEELGGTVSRNLAAEVLGVSHTALNRWVDIGEVPVVITPGGRREVPIPALLSLRERVEGERRSGRERTHALEAVMLEDRLKAARIAHRNLVTAEELESADRHRLSDLRGLAYHRAIAPQLRRQAIEEALRKVERWQGDGRMDPRHADAWRQLGRKPLKEIRRIIGTDDSLGRDLRQNSPLAGLLSEAERRKILETVR
jgi:hypothetical protein